jgi:hypothetical protein
VARPTEDGTPPTGPTTDHMRRTACLDGRMSAATIRRATAEDAEVLGITAHGFGSLFTRRSDSSGNERRAVSRLA